MRSAYPGLSAVLLAVVIVEGCGDRLTVPGDHTARPSPAHLVEVETVRRDLVSSRHELTGSLRTRKVVHIYNQEEGQIVQLPVFEGDQVRKGDLLVSLEDDMLRTELAKAKATTRQARLDVTRTRELVTRKAASENELAQAVTKLDVALAEQQLLETRLSHTRIRAPFDGVISARNMEPGDVVSRHSHILTLSDPGSLLMQARVSELLLPHLQPGDKVDVRIDALGERLFAGRILRIHPEVDSRTRMGLVEVVLEPVPAGAMAGQFTRMILHSAAFERIMIPFSALQQDRGGKFVYLMDEEGKVDRRPVRTGVRSGKRVEIREGLQPGQKIVTRGFLGLKPGKRVKPVNLADQTPDGPRPGV